MNVLIVGSGAREHAIGWAVARTPGARLWFAPGNAGTELLGTNLAGLDPRDGSAVAAAARQCGAELVLVGPEDPLGHGVADAVRGAGLLCFGPGREAARLETSKEHSKSFMLRHGVPTASTEVFSSYEAFRRHIDGLRGTVVVKKSGLAAGKGVLVSSSVPEILEFGKSALEADTVLVEKWLEGYELSVFALMDGTDYLLLPPCADHKKALDGDRGPNTGGMGAVCPVPIDAALVRRIEREVVEPTMRGLRSEGVMYRGVLFFGLMVTAAGPMVLEYNVRFGDPETQVLLPSLDVDWLGLMRASAAGTLASFPPLPAARPCVGVVLASPGYPDAGPKGIPARLKEPPSADVFLFHASTARGGDGTVRTGGGRCFTVVGRGASMTEARDRAYASLGIASFAGAWSRTDIGVRYVESGARGP